MNPTTVSDIVTLGAITGLRSMSGPATLAARGEGPLKPLLATLAVGEMLADKTSVVGNRTAPIPLAGRAIIGALLGSIVARGAGSSVVKGAIIGSGTAVLAAHLAYFLRTRSPFPNALSGVLEDAIVITTGAWSAARWSGEDSAPAVPAAASSEYLG